MIKECCLCKSNIEKKSKQWVSQVYCSAKCRKVAHRKGKSSKNRIEQKRANLHQNDEVLYLIRQCKKAGTIQILDGHTLSSFIETMALIKNRPPRRCRALSYSSCQRKEFDRLVPL
jgi:2-polyprenyl-6-methoxyphenol hydroxylase-like FAD-dependent oxidoreductase